MDETADARALEGFRIPGRALVSFSGGRTSAYMLWRILHAHGGALPPDFVVAFANTGREREETLRFVHECGARKIAEIVDQALGPQPEGQSPCLCSEYSVQFRFVNIGT